ncbi:MAG: hypothetical protein EOO07_33730, partial [Chitinophagaceae bacterium]
AMPVDMLPAIEKVIHKPVNFVVLPLFALVNTAFLLPSDFAGSLTSSLSIGVILGLVAGKPIGIFLFSRVLVFFKIASLPKNIKWSQVFGMGTLAGIGFTMSIFIANLAFTNAADKDTAKLAVLLSMLCSVTFSWITFCLIDKRERIIKEDAEHLAPI